ncbi:MAG: hypothetical protein PHW04_02230 [Candidatus Wallbacteria bacterium]|nr:hypothetical protein [Candidatus Wallbacteria bacterium]
MSIYTINTVKLIAAFCLGFALNAGATLIISSRTGQDFDLYRIEENSSIRINLTKTPEIDELEPSISPDGTKILFSARIRADISYADPRCFICLMNVDGSGLQRLTTPANHSFSASFSPDGQSVAFATNLGSDKLDEFAVQIMNSDGIEKTRISEYSPATPRPVFSKDGQRVLFDFLTRKLPAPRYDICSTDLQGGDLKILTCNLPDNYGLLSQPALSPDGTKLIFIRENYSAGEACSIVQLSFSDKKCLELHSSINVMAWPSYSRDGRSIVFESSGRTFILSSEGGKPRMIESDSYDINPAWRNGK